MLKGAASPHAGLRSLFSAAKSLKVEIIEIAMAHSHL
jgi:hypothetical protein